MDANPESSDGTSLTTGQVLLKVSLHQYFIQIDEVVIKSDSIKKTSDSGHMYKPETRLQGLIKPEMDL